MSKELDLVRLLINGANEYEKETGNKNPTVYLSRNNLLVIEKALLKAQEPKQYVDELKLVEKKLNALELLMQELDCKDFAELRKYARCGYERLNSFNGSKEFKIEIPESSLMDYNPVKQYLKWEDLEFDRKEKIIKVKLGDNVYYLIVGLTTGGNNLVTFHTELKRHYFTDTDKQLFNDLHLERVEE